MAETKYTARQTELIMEAYLNRDCTIREMAEGLGRSPAAVKAHIYAQLKKFGYPTNREGAIRAICKEHGVDPAKVLQ